MHLKQSIYKLPGALRKPTSGIVSGIEVLVWNTTGKTVPMPHREKMEVLFKYINKYQPEIFVETGTYLGQTVDYLEKYFEQIYSVELDRKLYKNAKKLFAGNKRIKILQGDSAIVLGRIIKSIKYPTLFWLDAHYSGGITAKGNKNTPVLKELTAITKNMPKGSVILIDDAREFNGKSDYPKLEVIKNFIAKKLPGYKINVEQDIIRICPV